MNNARLFVSVHSAYRCPSHLFLSSFSLLFFLSILQILALQQKDSIVPVTTIRQCEEENKAAMASASDSTTTASGFFPGLLSSVALSLTRLSVHNGSWSAPVVSPAKRREAAGTLPFPPPFAFSPSNRSPKLTAFTRTSLLSAPSVNSDLPVASNRAPSSRRCLLTSEASQRTRHRRKGQDKQLPHTLSCFFLYSRDPLTDAEHKDG
jgi:hypothetical protein